MTWNVALLALLTVSVLSVFVGYLGGAARSQRPKGPLQEFLLAGQGLSKQSVFDLLLSGSFSLNGMLYQLWLGYAIGLWALAVQAVWALSYVLLAHYVDRFRDSQSLHAFLGDSFGWLTRRLAGVCSIIGFTGLVGWEFTVGRKTFEGLISFPDPLLGPRLVTWFVIATIGASFLYTASGGLRGNAMANRVQNTLKFLVFVLLIYLLYRTLLTPEAIATVKQTLFPSFAKVIATLGWWGLTTNLAFSLVWQFVDMSTWQSVIASRSKHSTADVKWTLRWSGLGVFLAPGLIGTLLGALLANAPGVNENNVMAKVVEVVGTSSPVLMFVVAAALLAAIMSMVDGVLLAAAYSAVCDVGPSRTLNDLDADKVRSRRRLALVRVFLGVLAVLGTLGVSNYLVDYAQINLFDVVYVVIILQLSLTGPVFLALQGRRSDGQRMSAAIVAALLVGFAAFGASRAGAPDWYGTGAGVFTMLTSYVLGWFLCAKGRV